MVGVKGVGGFFFCTNRYFLFSPEDADELAESVFRRQRGTPEQRSRKAEEQNYRDVGIPGYRDAPLTQIQSGGRCRGDFALAQRSSVNRLPG